jgi:Rrf2 family protein
MLLHRLMQVSAKVDYGLRAMLELASRSQGDMVDLVSADELAHAQGIPGKFLEGILNQLRRSGLVVSRRGAEGGYRLARSADQITFAEVIRAIEGPLAGVRGVAPEDAEYVGAAEHMREVWIATRSAMRDVLESVTLAGALAGEFDSPVGDLLARPGAWERR